MSNSKSKWVRVANLYKQHGDKGTRLQSQNLKKALKDNWSSEDGYVQLQVWNNDQKQGFLDNSEDAHLVMKREELEDFIEYLQGL